MEKKHWEVFWPLWTFRKVLGVVALPSSHPCRWRLWDPHTLTPNTVLVYQLPTLHNSATCCSYLQRVFSRHGHPTGRVETKIATCQRSVIGRVLTSTTVLSTHESPPSQLLFLPFADVELRFWEPSNPLQEGSLMSERPRVSIQCCCIPEEYGQNGLVSKKWCQNWLA